MNLIKKWKVITSCLTAEHAGETDKNGQKRIISTLEILNPNVICTETYMLIGTFNTKQECINLVSYLKTKTVRALLGIVTSTQHMSKSNFRFVPLQDFTSQSDIDWSVSIPEIDEQLYHKYGLSDDEIAFIEKMIKPM